MKTLKKAYRFKYNFSSISHKNLKDFFIHLNIRSRNLTNLLLILYTVTSDLRGKFLKS